MSVVNDARETVSVELGALLDAGEGAVVTLEAGDARLVAHRAVLAARSHALASVSGRGSPEASSGRAVVPDVDGPTLRQLLVYFYTGEVPQLASVALQLLAAADRYGLTALRAQCEQQMVAQMAAAMLATKHSCPGHTESAVAFVASQGWEDAVLKNIKDVTVLHHSSEDLLPESREPPTRDSSDSSPAPAAPPDSRHCQTPAAAAPDPHLVSQLRNLPAYEKSSRVLQAAKDGAVELLRSLLAVGAFSGTRDWYRWTPLHYAASRGDVQAVECLLKSEAEVDARSWLQETPLHVATDNNHAAVVPILAAFGADVNARNSGGRTPLDYAALDGYAEVTAALLDAGADSSIRNEFRMTPLQVAEYHNHQQVIDILRSRLKANTTF